MIAFIINLLAAVAKAFFGERERTTASEQVGADKQAAATERQANEAVSRANTVVRAVRPLSADELPAHTASNDPDFRD